LKTWSQIPGFWITLGKGNIKQKVRKKAFILCGDRVTTLTLQDLAFAFGGVDEKYKWKYIRSFIAYILCVFRYNLQQKRQIRRKLQLKLKLW